MEQGAGKGPVSHDEVRQLVPCLAQAAYKPHLTVSAAPHHVPDGAVISPLLPHTSPSQCSTGEFMDFMQAVLESATVIHFFSTEDLWLRWCSKHQVHRCPELLSKHNPCRCALAGLLNCGAIRSESQGQKTVPVPLVMTGQDHQLCGQGTVEMFYQPIALRIKWGGSCLLYPQATANLTKHLGIKVSVLVTVEISRCPEASEHLLDWCRCPKLVKQSSTRISSSELLSLVS